MDDDNTPGIAAVLQAYGLRVLPEAHCFLLYQDQAIDLTNPGTPSISKSRRTYFFNEIIPPDGIGVYKIDIHRRVLQEWLRQQQLTLSLEDAWRIREDCIQVLSA
jgi:hypothetical protein